MLVQQIEAAAQAAQHAQPEDIDLEDADGVEIVLVPFDAGALLHRRILDRDHLVEPAAGDDEAAHMLGQMARKADQFARQRQHPGEVGIGGIEPDAARILLRHRLRRPAPQHAGERADGVVGEPEHLADLADGAAGAVADHGGGEAGAVAAIALVDVLDHDLAPLMLEIDVDVRRLVAVGRHEALEQEIDARRIDLGDAEAEAHRGIRRRAAALAQDVLRAGKAHDVVDGEEIGRVVERRDQRIFMVESGAHLLRNAVGITPARAFLGIGDQRLLGRGVAFAGLVGIFVFELVEGKPAVREQAQRLRHCVRRVAEQARHFLRRLEVALGIGFETPSGIGERHVLADASHDVLQGAPLGRVIEHVAGGEKRHPRRARNGGEPGEAARIIAAIAHAGAEPDARRRLAERREERRQVFLFGCGGPLQWPGHDDEI